MQLLDAIPILAFALSFVGLVANAKRRIWCWPVWTAANLCWIAVNVLVAAGHEIGWGLEIQAAIWVVFIAGNVYGWREWRKRAAADAALRQDARKTDRAIRFQSAVISKLKNRMAELKNHK